MDNLTLIIPAKNEKESLPSVLKELDKFNLKIFVILEKTDTETIEAIQNFNCKLIYQTHRGYGNALIEGIHNVTSKYFCIFDGDNSFNPKSILEMSEEVNNGADFVFGTRYLNNTKSDDDTLITKFGNFFVTKLVSILFNINTSDVLFFYVLGKKENVNKNINIIMVCSRPQDNCSFFVFFSFLVSRFHV